MDADVSPGQLSCTLCSCTHQLSLYTPHVQTTCACTPCQICSAFPGTATTRPQMQLYCHNKACRQNRTEAPNATVLPR
jgi:hypothetical protein